MASDVPAPESATRAELLEAARSRGIPGRSSMSRQQLVAALGADGAANSTAQRPPEDPPQALPEGSLEAPSGGSPEAPSGGSGEAPAEDQPHAGSRVAAFRRLAEERAHGEMVLMPRMLTGNDRRIHVRQTIREDHQTRIADRATDAQVKFDKLAGSAFQFFRGTALLFYRDMAGEDAWMPTVLALGDVHPGNFGVLPSADNVPVFGVNDFDEAHYAPFTWDLKRGATGFLVAADEKGGRKHKQRRRIVRRFVEGYADGMEKYAAEGTEQEEQLRLDNAPPLIADLIGGALEEGRADWLARKYLDEQRRGLRAGEELVPVSSRRDEFQEVVDRYVRENEVAVPARAGNMRVKDVAERKGAGTASLGLIRYYMLVEGPAADGTDDVLLELKQARLSALSGLAPSSDLGVDGRGDRIRHARRVQLVGGDAFTGSVDFDGLSFMVRERAPYRDAISLGKLSQRQWEDYAGICGRVLAHAHALSDDDGNIEQDIEPVILDAIGSRELFVDDILRFAEEAADRVRTDHGYFRADHALGAFSSIDVVYR